MIGSASYIFSYWKLPSVRVSKCSMADAGEENSGILCEKKMYPAQASAMKLVVEMIKKLMMSFFPL